MKTRQPTIACIKDKFVVFLPIGNEGWERSEIPLRKVRSVKVLHTLCEALCTDLKILRKHLWFTDKQLDVALAELSVIKTRRQRRKSADASIS